MKLTYSIDLLKKIPFLIKNETTFALFLERDHVCPMADHGTRSLLCDYRGNEGKCLFKDCNPGDDKVSKRQQFIHVCRSDTEYLYSLPMVRKKAIIQKITGTQK